MITKATVLISSDGDIDPETLQNVLSFSTASEAIEEGLAGAGIDAVVHFLVGDVSADEFGE